MRKKLHSNQDGLGHLFLIILIALVIGAVGFGAYRVLSSRTENSSTSNNTGTDTEQTSEAAWPAGNSITWEADGRGGWISLPYDATPPACPEPLQLNFPSTDIKQVTSILYPGQSRTGTFEGLGGTYKAHGGIRFDKNKDNDVEVVMPFNGAVFRASSDLVDGEKQYSFDIANDCGVMIRIGHLRQLTPAFQAIADTLPAPVNNISSKTVKITPTVAFKTGDKIATQVGFENPLNVGFDYGVYDLRKNNEASQDSVYQATHAQTGELTFHGLCWLDLLNDEEEKLIKALPAGDQANGKKSDYCK